MNGILRAIAFPAMRKSLLILAALLICSLVAMATNQPEQTDKVMTSFKYQPKQTNTVTPSRTFYRDLTSQEYKDRLARKGINVFHTFEAIGTDVNSTSHTKAPMREDEETYTLTVNLKYDKEEVGWIKPIVFSNDIDDCWFSEEIENETPDQIEFIVPHGNYDITVLLELQSGDFIIMTTSNVEVMDNMEIVLDSDDATVEICWNPLLPDGTNPTGNFTVYDPETFEIIEEGTGNVLNELNYLTILNKKHNYSFNWQLGQLTLMIGDITIKLGQGNIRTMPNNDYMFYFQKIGNALDGGYAIPLYANAAQSLKVTNDIENYITLKPDYAETPYQPEPQNFEFDKNKTSCMYFLTLIEGRLSSILGYGIISKIYELNKWIHVCQDPEIISEYQIMPIPALYEDWQSFMSGLPISTSFEKNTALAINQVPSLFNNLENTSVLKVTNPWLSFDITKPHVWNYGCPTLVFSTRSSQYGAFFNYAYIGRLGEKRNVDLLTAKATVSVDYMAPSEEILQNLQNGKLPNEGKIDFEFVDTNVVIGYIPGKNVTRIGFNMSCSDWEPPTLQLVRFVDNENNFIDQYAKGEDGVLEFYGGDFKYNQDAEIGANRYKEEPAADVKVEYAPYGTDSFLPLEVENISERDFMPGFGTYYRGSLANVDRMSENGWFDVRITLTDAAGNYQEQTLSPAFRIEECVGVETVIAPEIGVTVVNDNITVSGCENPIIEIYSTEGMLVNRISSKNIDASEFSHGIYLVNVIDGNKRAIRKIRL